MQMDRFQVDCMIYLKQNDHYPIRLEGIEEHNGAKNLSNTVTNDSNNLYDNTILFIIDDSKMKVHSRNN